MMREPSGWPIAAIRSAIASRAPSIAPVVWELAARITSDSLSPASRMVIETFSRPPGERSTSISLTGAVDGAGAAAVGAARGALSPAAPGPRRVVSAKAACGNPAAASGGAEGEDGGALAAPFDLGPADPPESASAPPAPWLAPGLEAVFSAGAAERATGAADSVCRSPLGRPALAGAWADGIAGLQSARAAFDPGVVGGLSGGRGGATPAGAVAAACDGEVASSAAETAFVGEGGSPANGDAPDGVNASAALKAGPLA
jgi:hypothetical protein